MITVTEAMDLIKNHQLDLPINILGLTHAFGLKVFEVSNWDSNLSGKIIRNEECGSVSCYAIYVNERHPNVRKRFTIAHELAHFIYHRDLIGDGIIDDGLYRSGLSNSQESMANSLAADILMPWHLLRKEIEGGCKSIEELAIKFEVSQAAMAIRLGSPC
jgi:Zn-dependent peptidase ImmA (M78 family)